jgi:hypothetical protein
LNEAQRLEQELTRNLGRSNPASSQAQQSPQKKAALAVQSATPSAAPIAAEILPPKSSASGPAEPQVADLLGLANVVKPSDVRRVEEGAAGAQAYQWKNGEVFGTAEERPITSDIEFDGLVKAYLQRTQKRCPGDFAVVPSETRGEGESRTDSYEVACVGAKVSSGASLLFYNRNGVFTVVAHEAPTQSLDQAINNRDMVLKALNTGS